MNKLLESVMLHAINNNPTYLNILVKTQDKDNADKEYLFLKYKELGIVQDVSKMM